MRTVDQVISALRSPPIPELPVPAYSPRVKDDTTTLSGAERVGCLVYSMHKHTTDEGFQLFRGLEEAGYVLTCFGMGWGTDIPHMLEAADPAVVVLQDKREWEGRTAGPGFDARERFTRVGELKAREDVFKLTVLKDAQHDPAYHRDSADEIGCHAWVVYYHPRIVKHLAPYVRPPDLIRTWHSLDADLVPEFSSSPLKKPYTCLVSGAVGPAYPLRKRIFDESSGLICKLRHPGYGRSGCVTPAYLKTLSQFRVSICTSSIYGYALRKIVESTACGCRVITDLPADDPMPLIDANLVRIDSEARTEDVEVLAKQLALEWNPAIQAEFAEMARGFYDYRAVGKRLADNIEAARRRYAMQD